MSLTVDIKKRFEGFCLDVSLNIDGVTGLLGASGSGKSMTLMCVAGIIKPDSGRIVLNGRALFDSRLRVDLPPQQRRVGYLFQNYSLFPNMTVRRNILCGMHGQRDPELRERALRDIIDMMRLSGLEGRRPGQLSGGQRQRAALARILVGSPDILMLDEPFSALDSHLRGQLQIELRALLGRFGKDVILVTHSRDEAYLLCPEIALIDGGTIIAHKNAKQLFADPESRQAALLTGCKNIVAAKKAGEYAVDVPEWRARLTTARPVRDDICAIGVRAHYFDPEIPQNRLRVRFSGEIEGPFEFILQFRCENQAEASQDIWWRVPKGKRAGGPPAELGVAPENIMLLYK